VRVSSALPPWKGFTFDGSNLIDGRDDTSWQPAKSKTMGVGQWIEIDLGATYEIDRIEVTQGLQATDPVLGDLFCRNNRMAYADLLFEDGTHNSLFDMGSDKILISKNAYSPYLETDESRRAVARKFQILVRSVLEPVDWKDLAVGEVRVFGKKVATPMTKGSIVCQSPNGYEFRTAIIEYCGHLTAEKRLEVDCSSLVYAAVECRAATGWMPQSEPNGGNRQFPAVSPAQVEAGQFAWDFPLGGAKVSVSFALKPGPRWVVKTVTRKSWDGKPVILGEEDFIELDKEKRNKCWEKLKKKRPVREEEPMYDSD